MLGFFRLTSGENCADSDVASLNLQALANRFVRKVQLEPHVGPHLGLLQPGLDVLIRKAQVKLQFILNLNHLKN